MDADDWVTLVFREQKTLRIHVTDLALFKNTGLDEMIDLDYVLSPNIMDREAFIPRDIKTFNLFLDFLSGYGLARARDKDPERLVRMLRADNEKYKVPGMRIEINRLAYYHCSHLLTSEELEEVFSSLQIEDQARNVNMLKKIHGNLELIDEVLEEMDESDQNIVKAIRNNMQVYLPYERLHMMHTQIKKMLQYTKFKEDMEARLPHLLNAMVNALGFLTLKQPHPDAANNIKHVIRNEPTLIKDLYKNLSFLRLRSFTQVILSSLTQLFLPTDGKLQ